MSAHDEGDDIVFSSGRRLHANCGIVGIDSELEISEGYDGGIAYYVNDPGPHNQFSGDDMRELADLMIARWQRFKAAVQ